MGCVESDADRDDDSQENGGATRLHDGGFNDVCRKNKDEVVAG
jgi:hypothetical protein